MFEVLLLSVLVLSVPLLYFSLQVGQAFWPRASASSSVRLGMPLEPLQLLVAWKYLPLW